VYVLVLTVHPFFTLHTSQHFISHAKAYMCADTWLISTHVVQLCDERFSTLHFASTFIYPNMTHKVCRATCLLACVVQVWSSEAVVDGEVKAKEDVPC